MPDSSDSSMTLDLNSDCAGQVVWQPSRERIANSRLVHYLDWLRQHKGLNFAHYTEVHAWSVKDTAGFWLSIFEYFEVESHSPWQEIVVGPMPGTRWFTGATLNYAEHALRHPASGLAVIACSESGQREQLSYGELRQKVAGVRASLAQLGVRAGDRVVGYLPNTPSAVIAFLACASLGAIWSSCPPEFGVQSVLDRFRQIEPKVLFTVLDYRYAGKTHDRADAARDIVRGLPSLVTTVLVHDGLDLPAFAERALNVPGKVVTFAELASVAAELVFEPLPFEHPLWILYSSGTTGLPKAIVHGHGGILLEHLKELGLHADLKEAERFFWFSTTGWMMWNYLVSGLLLGTTIVLYDGSPGYPDLGVLFQLAEAEHVSYFGSSAPFIMACKKAGLEPKSRYDLGQLTRFGSTGAPLPAEGFVWVYEHVKSDVLLASVSGGTDLCTAFVGACPLLPVRAGELQCRTLGSAVESFGESGESLLDEVGELVITKPMPSMPIAFWNDADGARYRASYFDTYPGVWRHGDWIRILPHGGAVIYGRSDSTLNRGGVRMGTSEFYRVIEGLGGVDDSLVIDTSELGVEGKLWLFVVLAPGHSLTAELRDQIRQSIRVQLSPRHVPDEIREVSEIPRTLSGKKLEVPIKRIMAGVSEDKAVNRGTLKSPQALADLLASIK